MTVAIGPQWKEGRVKYRITYRGRKGVLRVLSCNLTRKEAQWSVDKFRKTFPNMDVEYFVEEQADGALAS